MGVDVDKPRGEESVLGEMVRRACLRQRRATAAILPPADADVHDAAQIGSRSITLPRSG